MASDLKQEIGAHQEMTMELPDRHRDNRRAWNEAATHYEAETDDDIAFLRGGGKHLCRPELQYLRNLHVWCKRAIHLQCAAGHDTLSLWNQGATEVVGLDISDKMINEARRKSDALKAPALWYCCDILEAPTELDGTADLVYTGRGASSWIMDIVAWSRVVARLQKPGGRLYVFEGHPLDWVWDQNASELRIDSQPPYGDYFSDKVGMDKGWPETYIPSAGLPPTIEQATKHERQWTLGHVLNSLVEASLRLERFDEYP